MFESYKKAKDKPLIILSTGLDYLKKKRGFNTKLFFIIISLLALGAGFYYFNNILRGYLQWKYSVDVYEKALAEMPVDYSFLKPFRNWNVDPLEISAKAAIAYYYDESGNQRILYAKNIYQPLPIASISKLFSSYVAVKSFDLKKEVEITKDAIDTEENTGQFWLGEKFTLKDLLHSALIESSNDAITAIADLAGKEKFIRLLNQEVKKIGLSKTFFHDPVGLDPDYPNERYNTSSAYDLAKFASFLVRRSWNDPLVNLILKITQKPEYYLYRPDGSFHHKMINTNKLLFDKDFLKKYEIVGSKTGSTPMAGECFLLITKGFHNKGFIVTVVLGSKHRFEDVKNILKWIQKAYIW